jgi:Galactose oxidase, central domain
VDELNWSRIREGGMPARTASSMTYHPTLGGVVVFGGVAPAPGGLLNDLWLWTGADWLQQPSEAVPARANGSIAYDPRTQALVLFGGLDEKSVPLDDTWTWDGAKWTAEYAIDSPHARTEATMLYNEAEEGILLFGGRATLGRKSVWDGETWLWARGNWTRVESPASPEPRAGASMAFDSANSNVVLFGGATTGQLGDTWVWDGATWVAISPSVAPSARASAGMAYYEPLQGVVLFGGEGALEVERPHLQDTWLWKGQKWLELSPGSMARGGQSSAMAYDANRKKMVLLQTVVQKSFEGVGEPSVPATVTLETWELG